MVPQSTHWEAGIPVGPLCKARRWVGARAGVPQSGQVVVEGVLLLISHFSRVQFCVTP